MNKTRLIWIIVILLITTTLVNAVSINKITLNRDTETYIINSSIIQYNITLGGNLTTNNTARILSCSGNSTLCNWNANNSLNYTQTRYSSDFIYDINISETGVGYRPANSQLIIVNPPINSGNTYEIMEVKDNSGNLLCSNFLINNSINTSSCSGLLYNGSSVLLVPSNISVNSSVKLRISYGKSTNFGLFYYNNFYLNDTFIGREGVGSCAGSGSPSVCSCVPYDTISGDDSFAYYYAKSFDDYRSQAYGKSCDVFINKDKNGIYIGGYTHGDYSYSTSYSTYYVQFKEKLVEGILYNFTSNYQNYCNCGQSGSCSLNSYFSIVEIDGEKILGNNGGTGWYPSNYPIQINISNNTAYVWNGTIKMYNISLNSSSANNRTLKFYGRDDGQGSCRMFNGDPQSMVAYTTLSTVTKIVNGKYSGIISFNNTNSDSPNNFNIVGLNNTFNNYPSNLSIINLTNNVVLYTINGTINNATKNIFIPKVSNINQWILSQSGFTGDIAWYHQIVVASTVSSSTLQPGNYLTNSLINASINTNGFNLTSVLFTLWRPSGTIYSLNDIGSHVGNFWVSSSYLLNETGNYVYNITTVDNIMNTTTTYNYYIAPLNITGTLITETYVNSTVETNITSFSLNLSDPYNLISSVNISLVWNNTLYTPTYTPTINSSEYYNVSIQMPFVQNNNTLIPFYWNYTIRYVDGTNLTTTTTSKNQTITWINNLYSVTYSPLITDLDQNVINLTINNVGEINNLSAYLIYNNVSFNSTNNSLLFTTINPTSGIQGNNSFFWNFTINNNIFRNTSVYNQNQNIINLSNCSGNLTYNFFVEGTSTPIIANVTATYTTWYSNPSITKSFNFSYLNVNKFNLCISPNINLNTNYKITYSGINTRNYQVINGMINNSQNYSLYLSSNTARNIINFVDQYNTPLMNYLVNIYLNNVLIDSELVDINGNINIDFNSANKYDFKIYDSSGVFVFDTGNTLITTNPQVIKIGTSEVNQFETIVGLDGLQYSLLVYNSSHIVNFTWLNNAGYQGKFCLVVYNYDDGGNTNTFRQCSLNNSYPGSIAYNFSSWNGSIVASAYADDDIYLITTLSYYLDFSGDHLYDFMGLDALFWQAILSALFGFAFIYIDPALIPVGLALSLFTGMVITLIPVTITGIIAMLVLSAVTIITMRT